MYYVRGHFYDNITQHSAYVNVNTKTIVFE